MFWPVSNMRILFLIFVFPVLFGDMDDDRMHGKDERIGVKGNLRRSGFNV
jgi:hypothetical protein